MSPQTLSPQMLKTLEAVRDGSTDPLHNRSLTLLSTAEMIIPVPMGNGWAITVKGRQELDNV